MGYEYGGDVLALGTRFGLVSLFVYFSALWALPKRLPKSVAVILTSENKERGMDPDFRSPVSPGTPLFPLSSERANARKRPPPDSQQQTDSMTHQLSPSPSLSALPHLLQNRGGHLRGASDVQGKVAQFNGLAKEAAQRRKDSEAALRRAIVGREEAEAESKRLRDSNEILRREIEGGRGRERRVLEKSQTLEVRVLPQR